MIPTAAVLAGFKAATGAVEAVSALAVALRRDPAVAQAAVEARAENRARDDDRRDDRWRLRELQQAGRMLRVALDRRDPGAVMAALLLLQQLGVSLDELADAAEAAVALVRAVGDPG